MVFRILLGGEMVSGVSVGRVPGWKGPRRLVVAVQDFVLFSGFDGCMWFTLNHARQPGDNECDRA